MGNIIPDLLLPASYCGWLNASWNWWWARKSFAFYHWLLMPVNRSSGFLQPNWESARNKDVEAEGSFLTCTNDKRVNTFLKVTEDGLSSGSRRPMDTVSFQIWRNIFSVLNQQTVALVTKKPQTTMAGFPVFPVSVVGDQEKVVTIWLSWCPSSQKKMASFCHCKEKLCYRKLARWSEGKW